MSLTDGRVFDRLFRSSLQIKCSDCGVDLFSRKVMPANGKLVCLACWILGPVGDTKLDEGGKNDKTK